MVNYVSALQLLRLREQHERPALRDRSGARRQGFNGCIATSYEVNVLGVKTGPDVREVKKLPIK